MTSTSAEIAAIINSTNHRTPDVDPDDPGPMPTPADPHRNEPTPDRVKHRRDELHALLLDDDGLANIPIPAPIVDDWLFLDSVAWLHGKPGGYKSFVAVDLACSVALGLPWHGHTTRQGPVVYIAAEAVAGLDQRVDAWRLVHGQPASGVRFLAAAPQLLDPVDRPALIQLLTEIKPVLIIADTQARMSIGAEENSAKDAGTIVSALEELRAATRACVLVLHHEPRSGENLRGSTAFEGAASTIIRAERDGAQVVLTCRKQRDAPEASDLVLVFRPFGVSGTLFHGVNVMTGSETDLLGVLRNQFGTTGASWTRLADASGMPKATLSRALQGLRDRGLVRTQESGRSRTYIPSADDQPRLVPPVPGGST